MSVQQRQGETGIVGATNSSRDHEPHVAQA